MSEVSKAMKDADALVSSAVVPEERELAEALIAITKKYGKFNEDDTGVWAGYTPASENENAEKGVNCANCILYEGGTTCAILATDVEPMGSCRFALIPDGVVRSRSSEKNMSFNCIVCDESCACSVGPCNCPPTCTCPCRRAVVIVAGAVVIEKPEYLAEALVEITERFGKFDINGTDIPVDYEGPEENDHVSEGLSCANCVLYEGGSTCKILNGDVEPLGYCRFVVPRSNKAVAAAASRPAPKKDRIYGSKKNKPGSADGTRKIVFSDKVETALRNKMREHNEKASPDRQATMSMLKAVYRRGAGAFSSSHRPGKTRDQWAMARVNAYLRLLKSGRPANPNYKQDNDLLPKKHPKSSRGEMSITASAAAASELEITLFPEDEYESPEHVIIAMAEYSGLGYDAVPAFRATWIRAVNDVEDPFERVKELAVHTYDSRDADLLPKV